MDDKKPLFHKYRPSGDTIIRNKKNQEQIGNRKITLFRTTYDLNIPTIKWDASFQWLFGSNSAWGTIETTMVVASILTHAEFGPYDRREGAPLFSCTKLIPSPVRAQHFTNIEFSYFRLRSGGGVVGTSKDVDGDDELEEVSDSEFDKLLDEQERGWENKTGKKFDYNYIATPKERKKMKRKNEHKMDSEFQELDDDEPDFDDLYSDQSDHDEGSDDGMDFEFQGMTLLRE